MPPWGEMKRMEAAPRLRCPGAAGGTVLTSVPVTPGPAAGAGRAGAAKEPGRGVPVNAAVTRPGSSVPPVAPGRGHAGSAAPGGRGGSVPGAGGAARSAAARPDPPGSRAALPCPA